MMLRRLRINPVERGSRLPSRLEALCTQFPRLDRVTIRAIIRRYPGATDLELRQHIEAWLKTWESRQ
jgi:hypothetical protein